MSLLHSRASFQPDPARDCGSARPSRCRPWRTYAEWLDDALGSVVPQSLTGKTLGYLDAQWPKLVRVFEHGEVPLDTNAIENAVHPFAVGRPGGPRQLPAPGSLNAGAGGVPRTAGSPLA